MDNGKKVYMILTNGFDPDVRVYKEAKYLVAQGFDLTILCWDRKCEYIEKEENLDGIKIKRFSIKSAPGTGMKQILPYLKFMKCVKKYLKHQNYGYLHCHDFDGIMVGMFTKKKKDKKIIFDMHEIYNNYAYAKNCIFKKVFNYVLKKVDYIIYVNDEQIKNINYKEKLVFLPNYPEKEIYIPIQKNKSDKMRINYIGCLRDYDSLKALANLSKENLDLQIGFYGMGTEYKKLLENCKELPVNIYGKYDGVNESGEIYRNTDILYCSYNPDVENWKNAYPVKLFEAVVTQTPIIVTRDTAVGNFVDKNGIGELIDYCDENLILKVIIKIKENYQQYVDNLMNISDKYQWENIVKNLIKIYKGG